jgi:hypothetical protein
MKRGISPTLNDTPNKDEQLAPSNPAGNSSPEKESHKHEEKREEENKEEEALKELDNIVNAFRW